MKNEGEREEEDAQHSHDPGEPAVCFDSRRLALAKVPATHAHSHTLTHSYHTRTLTPISHTHSYLSHTHSRTHPLSRAGCLISHHILSHRITSHRIISYHIISYHIISYHVVQGRVFGRATEAQSSVDGMLWQFTQNKMWVEYLKVVINNFPLLTSSNKHLEQTKVNQSSDGPGWVLRFFKIKKILRLLDSSFCLKSQNVRFVLDEMLQGNPKSECVRICRLWRWTEKQKCFYTIQNFKGKEQPLA